jgi:hypothetical protein
VIENGRFVPREVAATEWTWPATTRAPADASGLAESELMAVRRRFVTPRTVVFHRTTASRTCRVSAGMTYAVLLKIDAGGEWPVVAGPDTDLHAHAKKGVRWRLVAQTDDVAEAYRLHALLQLQRECREP